MSDKDKLKSADDFCKCLDNLPIHKQWDLKILLGKTRTKKLEKLLEEFQNE